MKTKAPTSLIALSLFVFLFVFFLYTFLHESGHAIAGWLFGQSLTEFNVSFWTFNAYVSMVGGDLTDSQLAIQAMAGASLPLVIWSLFISLVPRKASFSLELLKLLSSLTVINTLLPWIILPILFMLGQAPPDDVTHFLRYSEMPPLLLAFIASILYAGGWILFLSKIESLRNEFLLFTTADDAELNAGTRRTIPVMAGIMASCVVAVVVLNGFAARNPIRAGIPPQHFSPVAHIYLSRQAYDSETLTQFTLDKRTFVGVFVAVQDINTSYFDLCVTGPNGFRSVVLHGEGYSAAQDNGLWEENLPPGTYQVVLTSHESPGIISVYMKTR